MLESIRNLDYLVLLCHDLNVMKDFYHRIIGFPVYLETASWIGLRVGAVLLTRSKRKGRPFVGPALPKGSAAVQLAFRVTPQAMQSCYE